MSALRSEITQRAHTLPSAERAQLAEDLLASLQEGGNAEIGAAWDDEIQIRLDEIERGVAVLVPAEDVFAEVHRITQ